MESQPLSEETQEHFDFLDELRRAWMASFLQDEGFIGFRSGRRAWMASFLQDEFPDLSKSDARDVLMAWMDSFK